MGVLIENDVYICYELDELDFYPPEDDRLYCSGIDDVFEGDCFSDYVEMFWDMYECDIYDCI